MASLDQEMESTMAFVARMTGKEARLRLALLCMLGGLLLVLTNLAFHEAMTTVDRFAHASGDRVAETRSEFYASATTAGHNVSGDARQAPATPLAVETEADAPSDDMPGEPATQVFAEQCTHSAGQWPIGQGRHARHAIFGARAPPARV